MTNLTEGEVERLAAIMDGDDFEAKYLAATVDNVTALIRDWRALTANLQAHREAMEAFKQVLDKREEENTALRGQLAYAEQQRDLFQQLATKNLQSLQETARTSHMLNAEVSNKVFKLAQGFRERLISDTFALSQEMAVKAISAVNLGDEWPGSYYKPHFIRAVRSLTLDQVEQETQK